MDVSLGAVVSGKRDCTTPSPPTDLAKRPRPRTECLPRLRPKCPSDPPRSHLVDAALERVKVVDVLDMEAALLAKKLTPARCGTMRSELALGPRPTSVWSDADEAQWCLRVVVALKKTLRDEGGGVGVTVDHGMMLEAWAIAMDDPGWLCGWSAAFTGLLEILTDPGKQAAGLPWLMGELAAAHRSGAFGGSFVLVCLTREGQRDSKPSRRARNPTYGSIRFLSQPR
jgi:hypothetical protein